jgi:non-canonical (house-cleaning) NTP pyrophosphatase
MKIVINNNRKIFAIQEEFSKMFPRLKIEFFAKPSRPGAIPSKKLVRHSSKTLQDCRAISREGTIDILPSMNISDLKENFRDVYGLSVEIFRKAENGAAENPVSDKLTLEETNKQD